MQNESQRRTFPIWIVVFIVALNVSIALVNVRIFPMVKRNTTVAINGYSKTYYKQKETTAEHPLDKVIKISLMILVAFAYWKSIGYLTKDAIGLQMILFLVSIPIAYLLIFYIAWGS